MNSSFYKYLLLTVLYIPVLQGQSFYNPYNHFNLLFESSNKVNPYFVSGNPAYLGYDGRDELLSINAAYDNEDGSLRKFFDPGTERNYDLSFSGKKTLDSSQTFKGLFAIQRMERKDWAFLATKDYNSGSLFLLGDSTTGGSRYNGIFMNVQYSARLFGRLLTGVSVDYYVDEGMKEISPRPTSEHRDINATAGFGYLFSDNLSAGLSFNVYDKNEKIVYAEDEGALYTETILFKIRGLDLWETAVKKTEQRYSYYNSYNGTADIYYHNDILSAVCFAGNTVEHITVKDNGTSPVPEGYWENTSVHAGAEAMFYLSDKLNAGLLYKYSNNDMWAKHPAYNVLINSTEISSNEFGAGLQYKLTDKLSAGLEINASLSNEKCDDYYSDIYYDIDRFTISPLLGLSYSWNKYLFTHAAFGIINSVVDNYTSSAGHPGVVYYAFTSRTLDYLAAEYTGTRCYLKAEINPGVIGLINVYVGYTQINAGSNTPAYFGSRNNLQASVEFKIKAY
jgi:hypothetical protein